MKSEQVMKEVENKTKNKKKFSVVMVHAGGRPLLDINVI